MTDEQIKRFRHMRRSFRCVATMLENQLCVLRCLPDFQPRAAQIPSIVTESRAIAAQADEWLKSDTPPSAPELKMVGLRINRLGTIMKAWQTDLKVAS